MGYIVYKDVTYGIEREKFVLKVMSRDLQEYTELMEEDIEEEKAEEGEIIIPIEEASVEQILKAEEI